MEYGPDGLLLHREGFWHKGPVLQAGAAQSRGGSWRFSDDGTETGAVLLGTVNTNPAKGDLVNGTVYHLRFGIEEAQAGSLMNFSPQLRYNKNSTGWVDVNGSSSNIQSAAGGLVDGEDTVARSGVSQGEYTEDTTNEGADEVDGIAGGNTADLSMTGAEFVWSFQIVDGDVADDDTIEIRPYEDSAGTVLDFYDQSWPTITIEKDAGVTVGITNVLATAAVGAVQALFSLLLSTVLATSAVGSVSPGVTVALTGVGGTSAVGSVGVTKSGSVALTGVGGTSAVGTVGNGTSVALTSADGGSDTLDLQIVAGADDIYHISDDTINDGIAISIGQSGSLIFEPALRFLAAIPQGANITAAWFSFTSFDTRTQTVLTNIYAHDADASGQITNDSEWHAAVDANLTSAFTPWDITTELVGGVEYDSPSIVGVIQELVDRPGFNGIVHLIWLDDGSENGELHNGDSYDGSPSEAARLHVEFATATTAAVGSVGPANSQDITGVEGTSAVGSVSAGGDVEAELAGVGGTAAVGNVSFTKSGSVGLTGVGGVSAVDDVAPGTSLPLTGVGGTSAVGSVDDETSVPLLGEEGIGAVGSVDNETEVPLTGVGGTSAVGSVSVEGEAGAVLTGVGGTAAVGNVSFTESGSVGLTGVGGTSAEGDVGVSNTQDLSGEEATAAVGSVSPSSSAPITGEEATSIEGDVGVQASQAITGEEATAAVGDVGVTKSGSAALTGVGGTAAVGSVKAADVGEPMTASPSISPVMTAKPSIQPVMTATPDLEP